MLADSEAVSVVLIGPRMSCRGQPSKAKVGGGTGAGGAAPPWGAAASVPGGVPRRGKDTAAPHGGERFVQFSSPETLGDVSGKVLASSRLAQRLLKVKVEPGARAGTNRATLRELMGAALSSD